MLNQLKEGDKKDEQLWIEFDAWKYPDRSDLWEGFVLDFADQVGRKRNAANLIDGDNKSLNILSSILSGFGVGAFGKLAKNIFEKTPAKRIFEIQEILTQIIKSQKKNIFIIVEDADRSGDKGIFFLETLKQFLKNLEVAEELKVLAIIPISKKSYEDSKTKDSYLKCLDYVRFFNLKTENFEKFVKKIFSDEVLNVTGKANSKKSLIETNYDQMISFFEGLFIINNDMTIRELKIILRGSNATYQAQKSDGRNPDYRLSIMFEASKHLRSTANNNLTIFDEFKRSKKIHANGPEIFSAFLKCIKDSNLTIFNERNNNLGLFRVLTS